ncbi:MAG: acyltransferase [Prevotella sp.]|nr:acyltransferase [Prevotella sp.]
MILLIIFLFLLLLYITNDIWKKRQNRVIELHDFNVQNTLAIRGLLALLIALHHFSQAVDHLNLPIIREFVPLGAVIVGVFFFLTGYGLMISYMKKGNNYLSNFLSHRFLKLLPAFIITNIAYLCILSLISHTNAFSNIMRLKDGITPLPGSWFIYSIIYFYLAFYVTACLFSNKKHMIISLWGASFLYVIIVRLLGWGNYWFMSIYALNIGQCYAYNEKRIKSIIKTSPIIIHYSIWSLFALYVFVWITNQFVEITTFNRLYYCFTSIFVVYAIYFLGAIPSKLLRLVGEVSYEFYLVHGIFIHLLGFMKEHWILYLCTIYLSSFITAWLLHKLCKLISH